MEASGGNTIDVTGSIQVFCSNAVQITYVGSDPYATLTKTSTVTTSDVVLQTTDFASDDVTCPIEEFSFTETSVPATGYPLS